MNTMAIFSVFFLGLFSFSISHAQTDHLSVVTGHLQGTVVVQNQPLSETERDALVSYLEDLKQDYVTSMQQAEAHLDDILAATSPYLQKRVKSIYFKFRLLHIIGIEYIGRKPLVESEAEIFDKTIALVERNDGSGRALTEIQRRLNIIERRKDIVTKSLDDILHDNIHLPVWSLPFNTDGSCEEFDLRGKDWNKFQVYGSLYGVKKAVNFRETEQLARGVRLDEKLLSFYKQIPTLVCSSPWWFQIYPPASGISYDAPTHTFTLTADHSSTPTYTDLVKIVKEQINKQ